MSHLKKPLIVASCLIVFFITAEAMAACRSTMSVTPAISVPLLDIPRDTAVGTLLYEGTIDTTVNVSSNTGSSFNLQARNPINGVSSVKYNGRKVFNTNIQGVGISFGDGFDAGTGVDLASRTGRFTGEIKAQTRYYVIKTAAMKTGTLSGNLMGLFFNCAGVNGSDPYGKNITHTSQPITVKSCTIANKNIVESLEDAPEGSFTGKGSTFGDKTFNVEMDCDGDIKVRTVLASTTPSPDAPGVMLSPGTPGIGVQFLHAGTPLVFGAKIAVGDALPGDRLAVPFVIRYYQTADNYKAGKVSVTGTLTMTYE